MAPALREQAQRVARCRSSSCWARGHRTVPARRHEPHRCRARRHQSLRRNPAWAILPWAVHSGLRDSRRHDGGVRHDASGAVRARPRGADRRYAARRSIRPGHPGPPAVPMIRPAPAPGATPGHAVAPDRAAARVGVRPRGAVRRAAAHPGGRRRHDDRRARCLGGGRGRPAAVDRVHRGADHHGHRAALRRFDVPDAVRCDADCVGAECRCRAHWSRWPRARPGFRTGNA